ncbi:phosphate ABC transporter substrate-binding/OmpA family protein [Roseovarius phycicola]|uniref:phosphate ABC transporter substrate-binding/OmpA family protein n=1 Tax=Roseovarius phycicola TaxID=3080976 RepID=UPI0030D22067
MVKARVAGFAALLFWVCGLPVFAQDVTLTSRDGRVEISGNLLGFDGEFYRVDTIYGELTVDGSGVDCAGPGCPNLETFIAQAVFSGAPTIGRMLLPALLEAFAIRSEHDLSFQELEDGTVLAILADPVEERVVGEVFLRLNNSDTGIAELIQGDADIAMSMREIRDEELRAAQEEGLGDLEARGRSRVVALDALVPMVSPSNPVQVMTLPDLAGVLSGETMNWSDLGGPDAPISVHVHGPNTGLGQAIDDLVLKPAGKNLTSDAKIFNDGRSLSEAVTKDPFALGLTSQTEVGNNWALALGGGCGFALQATRRAVKTEDYPLTAPVFLYVPARRFPKLVREFLAFLRDPSAQLVIRRAGFVDQGEEEISVNEQGDRFANAITLAGPEVSLDELQRLVASLSPLRRLTTSFRFEPGSARLDAQSRSNVLRLARALEQGRYDTRRLLFVGFSDGEGAAATNKRIAMRRAEAVRDAVRTAAETANLTRVTMDVDAFGEALPMACDETAWGRRINRRVEVWIR